jgi:hypothetical protein
MASRSHLSAADAGVVVDVEGAVVVLVDFELLVVVVALWVLAEEGAARVRVNAAATASAIVPAAANQRRPPARAKTLGVGKRRATGKA